MTVEPEAVAEVAQEPARLRPNLPLGNRVIARERQILGKQMRRLSGLDHSTGAYVYGNLIAQMAGYFGASLTAATPGYLFTPELMTEWLVNLLHEYEREKYRDDGASTAPRQSSPDNGMNT